MTNEYIMNKYQMTKRDSILSLVLAILLVLTAVFTLVGLFSEGYFTDGHSIVMDICSLLLIVFCAVYCSNGYKHGAKQFRIVLYAYALFVLVGAAGSLASESLAWYSLIFDFIVFGLLIVMAVMSLMRIEKWVISSKLYIILALMEECSAFIQLGLLTSGADSFTFTLQQMALFRRALISFVVVLCWYVNYKRERIDGFTKSKLPKEMVDAVRANPETAMHLLDYLEKANPVIEECIDLQNAQWAAVVRDVLNPYDRDLGLPEGTHADLILNGRAYQKMLDNCRHATKTATEDVGRHCIAVIKEILK